MKIKLILDIMKSQQSQLNAIVTGRQGDKQSVTVNVFVVDGGVPYNLTGNTIFYEGLKPNNQAIRDTSGIKIVNATQGNFEYTFVPETFGVAGVGKRSYFSIEQGGTVRASTQDFGLVTVADALTGHALSGPYISELEVLKAEAQRLVNDINDRWVSVNDQLNSLQTAVTNLDVVRRKGDTMTGQLTYTNSSPISYRPLGQNWWLQITSATGLEFNPSTTANAADWNWGRAFIMNKNGVLDVEGLNVRGTNTNLLKKTGDTMTGDLSLSLATGQRKLKFTGANVELGFNVSDDPASGNISLMDWKGGFAVFGYNPFTKVFGASGGVDFPWIKKTGDTMTGDLSVVDGKGISFMDVNAPTVRKAYISSSGNITSLFDSKSGGRVWWYDHTTQTFTIDKATNLLKKTGDSMTGDLSFVRPNGGNTVLGFDIGDAGKRNYLYGGKNVLGAYSEESSQLVWRYTPSTKIMEIGAETFNVNSTNTNLLKKSGDTMAGHLAFGTNKELQFKTDAGAVKSTFAVDGNGNFFAWNKPAEKYLMYVNGTTGETIVNADNLVKKAGDNFTGTMTFGSGNAQILAGQNASSKNWLVHRPLGNSMIFVPSTTALGSTWDWSKQIEFKDDGTIKQANDTDWVNIPLQPNVANIDGRISQAKRSGGTVTLQLNYKATSLTNNFVMKLSAAHAPSRTMDMHITDGGGTVQRMTIDPDGSVYCGRVGQDMRATITYVI